MFYDTKLGTAVVAHEKLSEILRDAESITSALTSVIDQTTIIGQDVRYCLNEHEAFRRDVRAIHRKLDVIEAHSRTPKGSQTAPVTLCMELRIRSST